MAHGHHHDTGMCWDWDSVLLLSNPCTPPTSALEVDGNTTGGQRDHPGDAAGPSLDHGHIRRSTARSNVTSSNNHGNKKSGSSESHRNDSSGDKRRDPRLDCPNFLAGRVPCACTDNDDDDSGVSRKRSKPVPRCQVAACGAELKDLKGYHQRHRVCLRCAHATRVILRDHPHRYCQQCGKFHPICDFDEGKRSCRRKLEKHNNRRRRKAGEDSLAVSDYGDTDTLNEGSPGDGTKGDALSEGEVKDCVANTSFDVDDTLQMPGISSEERLTLNVELSKTSGLSQMSTDIPLQTLEPGVAAVLTENVPTVEHTIKDTDTSQHVELKFSLDQPSSFAQQAPVTGESHQQSVEVHLNGFSLDGSPLADTTRSQILTENGEESLLALLMDENAATEDSQFSESNGELVVPNSVQLRESSTSPGEFKEVAYSSPLPTGRISFKLYDWNPGDFPRQLRQQVMEWLSNMPVDLEGYIRSGCTILTMFIAMPPSVWEDLKADWARTVLKLVKAEQSLCRFWSSGYLIARIDDREVHINNGDIARPLSKRICESPLLDRVRPLCLEAGSDEEVVILGRNFRQPQSRLLVSFQGKYIVNDAYHSRLQGKTKGVVTRVHESTQTEEAMLFARFPALPSTSCGTAYIETEEAMLFARFPALPSTSCGTAYIEVEHISGTSNYIPLLVAGKDIADEIRILEKDVYKPRFCSQNLDESPGCRPLSQRKVHGLLMDLGWILKKIYLNDLKSDLRAEILELHMVRLRRLLFFGVKRRWYNVVERVLQLSSRAGLLERIGILENGASALQVAVLFQDGFMVKHIISLCDLLHASSSKCKFWWNLGFAGPKGLTALDMVALQPGARDPSDTSKQKCVSMWKYIMGFTRTVSPRFELRELTPQIERSSAVEHSEVTLKEVLSFYEKDRYGARGKGETRMSLPSLAWRATRRETGGMTLQRSSGPLRLSGHQGLTIYSSSSSKRRNYELLSSVLILIVLADLCAKSHESPPFTAVSLRS